MALNSLNTSIKKGLDIKCRWASFSFIRKERTYFSKFPKNPDNTSGVTKAIKVLKINSCGYN